MYLLDTNILSELVKKRPSSHLLSHLRSKPSYSLFTSCICVMELRYGSALRKDFQRFWSMIKKEIISRINIVPLGDNEALVAGDILAHMRKTGQSISIEDVLIASCAITHEFILVTANIRHFSKIKDLITEDWLAPL